MGCNSENLKVLVRGAGDLASGIIWNLAYAGFNVCCTEIENPSTIRTEVAFSSAVYDGEKAVDGVACVYCGNIESESLGGLLKFAPTMEKGSQSVAPTGGLLKFAPTMEKGSQSFAPTGGLLKFTPTMEVIAHTKKALASEIYKCWEENKVALIIDNEAKILDEIKFDVVVDAILAKKNLGTKINMAKLVIGVGPGFTANVDCHMAIETMRGHNLARIIESGSPMENTGVPGLIAGHSADRVMHSPASGVIHNLHKIGDAVRKGDILAEITEGSQSFAPTMSDVATTDKSGVSKVNVLASIDGILRGIIRDGYYVTKGLKIADIDPRLSEKENCFTISDKSRSIGAAVVVAINHHMRKLGE